MMINLYEMNTKSTIEMKRYSPEILFLSFFNVGFIKYAPGTFGTLAICPFLLLFDYFKIPFLITIPIFIISTVGSCLISEHIQKKYSVKDPQWIVIDEVLGMTLTWYFINHALWWNFLLAFILFRFFDIIKFWPASYFDKKMKHGAGVILDDLVSGVFAGISVFLINKIFF
jgi:phosphatidylglycerophosphatase A